MDTDVQYFGASLGSLASLGCPWRAQDRAVSTAVGATLIVLGVSAAAALSWLSLHLLVARPRAPTHLLLLQLCAAALACTVLSGFPFTGTSAVTGHWLYGAKGCIAQAFIQHLGVVVQLWTLSGLALERWLCSRPAAPMPSPSPPPPARWYARALALPWLLGVAVAAPPLAGWGSFGCDVSGVWCSVNWSGGNSGASFAYAVFALLAGRLVPATVTVWCLCGARVALPALPPPAAAPQAPRPRTPHSCSASRRAHSALNAVARLTAAGVLLLRAPRVILDLHLAAAGLSWDRAPRVLAYLAPVTDEASALVLPLVCALLDRSCRPSACSSPCSCVPKGGGGGLSSCCGRGGRREDADDGAVQQRVTSPVPS
ncbi:rhodopsin-like [Frankliniella occidentalis]|uniref:Rhodopsin-like n=1 Tax=Frankliniella occidentalis TaxID=133901 RepID=A0A9C6WXW9_FRAOC|nr:rhodopsin-like [Frankliniella occidentalis]